LRAAPSTSVSSFPALIHSVEFVSHLVWEVVVHLLIDLGRRAVQEVKARCLRFLSAMLYKGDLLAHVPLELTV
jgi:hypothetical protein